MNYFDCAFGHLAYNGEVDYKKCEYHYVNRLRVSYKIVYKNGNIEEYENVSWRSHAKKLWQKYLDSRKNGTFVK